MRLPAAARARGFRLEVLAARFPPGTSARDRQRRAVGIGELRGAGVRAASVPRRGLLRLPCGAAGALVGGRPALLRPVGTVADLDAGRPLRARPCGAGAQLPAGPTELDMGPGVFTPYLLRLRALAPERPDAAAPSGGRVLDPGNPGRGVHDDIRVALDGPSWLVLGESYNRGWRAECDGHSLGAPEVLDGFANGWRAPASCRSVRFAFAPNTPVRWGYWLSTLASLLLLGLLLLRRSGPADDEGPDPLPADDAPTPWPLPRAAAAGLAVGVVLGFVFAIRAGVVIAPAATLVLWRGIGPRALIAAAAAALVVVVPVVYLAFPAEDQGGYNVQYAVDHIGAHWVGVTAWVLLFLALVRTVAAARSNGGN